MVDEGLYARWWERMAASGDAVRAIQEWLEHGLRHAVREEERTDEKTADARGILEPFTVYLPLPVDDIPPLLGAILERGRWRSPDESGALVVAIKRMVTGWNYGDPSLSKAIILSFAVAARLEIFEVCDLLSGKADELLASFTRVPATRERDAVLTAFADMASALSEPGAGLLDHIADRCLNHWRWHRLIPFVVTRRLQLCHRVEPHAQRDEVLRVVAKHRKGLEHCRGAMQAIRHLTYLFVDVMRTGETPWTDDETLRLQEVTDVLDDEVLREDEGLAAPLRNWEPALARFREHGREDPFVEDLLDMGT